MTREQLQDIFESEFKWDNWKRVMNFVFPEFKFNLVQTDLTRDTKAHKQSAGYIKEHGTTQLASPEMLTLCEILVTDNVRLDRNIKSVRSLVADLAVPNYQTVIAVFHNADNTKWRFTLVVKEFTGANKVFDKKPDSYTYVFGVGEKGRTASERFLKLAGNTNKTLKDLEEAFSVEALSKKFFKEYKDIYQQFVEDIIKSPSRLALFKESSKEKQEKSARDFVKKMMGRLVFLYFLQKKGWLGCKTKWQGGDEAFMKTFVTKAKQDDNFYFQYLEPLFFDTLNDKRTKKDEDCIIQKTNFGKVPYLNGGLFEKDENHPKGLTLKWEILEAFFETLNNYNFTIIEDDPEFKEVAVDPEMLGHIFENLLEDNKDKGAFYTPKEIVHYMCQESLYEYLKSYLVQNKHWPVAESDVQKIEKDLQRFVKQKLASGIIDYDKPLAKALKEVKICDPAIGSGAFPMGLLNEIYHCVHKLHDESPDKVGDVWGIGKMWQGNKVKLNIIQNSIYGVDIEKGAVDIARLRFWLSLIVDEPEPTPLPNLEYKIVVGNSLVSKLGDDVVEIDWSADETTHGLFGAELAEKKKRLLQRISEEQKESFNPESDKHQLAEDIRSLKIDLLINQLDLMCKLANQDIEPKAASFTDKKKFVKATEAYYKVLGWKAQVKRLRSVRQKKSEQLDFFDWRLDFPEVMNVRLNSKPGFDIIIANPPYGADITDREFLKVKYSDVSKGQIDTYKYFIDEAFRLANSSGVISFITSDSYLEKKYFTDVRTLLASNSKDLVNLKLGDNVFQDVTLPTAIFTLTRGNALINYRFADLSNIESITEKVNRASDKGTYYSGVLDFNQGFIPKKSIINIFNCVRLIDVYDQVMGVKVYQIGKGKPKQNANHLKKNVFISDTKKDKNHLPFIAHKIERYHYKPDGLFINYGEWLAEPRDKKYFINQKIVVREIVNPRIFATIIDYPAVVKNIAAVIIEKDSKFKLKYLLAILNSKLFTYYLFEQTPKGSNKAYPSFTSELIKNLPIKIVDNKKQDQLARLTDQILELRNKGSDSQHLEDRIDLMIYSIYSIPYNQILTIDPDFSLAENEYNSLQIA